MTLGEITQRVQSLYSKGVHSADTRLVKRHIYSAVSTARSTLLRQRSDKKQSISPWLYQTLPCVELIIAPVSECPCAPANGCKILRSKYKLPKPISSINAPLINNVTTLDGNTRISQTTFDRVKYITGAKFTSKKPQYYIHNGYIYITAFSFLKAIPITMLADDVVEAMNFPTICEDCEDCQCKDIMDMDFPIDKDLVTPLLQIANQELILLFKQMSEDKSNNASDDTTTNIKSRDNVDNNGA